MATEILPIPHLSSFSQLSVMKTEKPDRSNDKADNLENREKAIVPSPKFLRKKIVNPKSVNTNINDFRYLSRSKNTLWFFILGVALLVGGIGLWALSRLQEPAPQTADEAAPPRAEAALPVRAVQAVQAPIQAWVFGEGLGRAVRFKHLTFNSRGTITFVKKVNGRDLREGDFVRQGELLALVDRRSSDADLRVQRASLIESQTQVSQAQASLQQAIDDKIGADASLEQAKASLVEAQANFRTTVNDREFAEREYLRRKELYDSGVITRSELDSYETQYKNAIAAIDGAQSQVNSARKQVQSAIAQVSSAQKQVESNAAGVRSAVFGVDRANAQLQKVQVDREDTALVAPFDGAIAHLNIRQGDYWTPEIVQAGSTYDTLIERIPIIVIDPRSFEVEIELPVFQGSQVRPGQRAFIMGDSERSNNNGKTLTNEELMKQAKASGRVFSVSPSVSPGARSVSAIVRIERGNANIFNNERVGVWIAVEEKNNAVVVPWNTLVYRDRIPYIFAVKAGANGERIAEQREVQRGIVGLTLQEIQTNLKPGEWVVTDGKENLVDGAPVDVTIKERGVFEE
ncbi:MAG: HlyD family efflux transporter periplasmic adaptor subunit [Cyanobacteria bacterium SBLK]|nr:HlyD family efflux transporter periplasmic adaptor subunit [Cyanobacteria bacterium SBLK]